MSDSNKKGHGEKTEEEFSSMTVNEIEEYEMKRAIKIAAIVCAFVFTFLTSVVAGCWLALWDMEMTPGDLFAAISGKGVETVAKAPEGLQFIDANDESSEESSGLQFIDANEEDTGLTFIDPEEDTGLTFIDPEEELADDFGGDASLNEDGAEDGVKAGDILEDGRLVVSSELAAVSTVMRAGSDQAIAVTSLSQTNISNPDESYPLPFTTVDESYFEDALFIGDSRLHGFGMWSGLPGTYYTMTGFQLYDYKTKRVVQTGNGKVPIFSALPYNAFTKIYIKVGLNEMGWGTEAGFEEVYAQLIADLRAMEPRAIIYVHAVLPVTAAKSATDRSHNNPNIIARNTSLKQFAEDQKAYFIDAGPVVSDESGCLKPEMTGDGIHLTSRYMGVWKQFLLEHAVVVPQ